VEGMFGYVKYKRLTQHTQGKSARLYKPTFYILLIYIIKENILINQFNIIFHIIIVIRGSYTR